MNFSDIVWLNVENISEDRIKYIRQKTKQVFDIKIMDALKPISATRTKDIEWARKRYNKKLKAIATACDITENL